MGTCLQCHFCGVGVVRFLVFVGLRVVLGLFFLSYCGVSSGVRDWSCVVVLCACRHLFLSFAVFRFLVSPILVNHFCCLLCFSFRERSDWKRVVVSPSGSSSSVVSSKVTCVPCLFVQFLFYFISCLVIPARTDLLEAGSAGHALNDVGVESSIIYQVCLLV